MKFWTAVTLALGGVSVANALTLPKALSTRDSDVAHYLEERADSFHLAFEKRRGGGRSGGYSGGRSGGSTSSRPPPNTRPTSNKGGSTSDGSGSPRTLGGGSFYGGGARVPFTAGKTSPGGLKPAFYPARRIGAFYPGLWLYGAYIYGYPLHFRNVTLHNKTQTKQLNCICQQFQVCGCDNAANSTYTSDLLGDGSFKGLNHSLVKLANFKGQPAIFINGSLANGTTAASFALGAQSMLAHASWGVVAAALASAFLLV